MEAEVLGEELARSMVVVKMRQTNIEGGRHAIEFTNHGVEITD